MLIAVLNGPNLNLLGQREPEVYGRTTLPEIEAMVRDAVLAVRIPFVELHLSNIFAREPERRHSVIADLAIGLVTGFGAQSYLLALQGLVGRLRAGGPPHR